jgi:hypothetical protein
VVSTAGWDSGHGTGRDHGPALLDGLAAAETHPPRPHVAPFRLAGGLEPLVVVTTDRCSDSDLRSAVGMSGPTGTTMVVFETGPATDRRAGRRLVRVGRGASFAEAWAIYTRMVMPA